MTIRNGVGFRTLLEEAGEVVDRVSPAELQPLVEVESVVVVDLRDVRELEREGRIPGSMHAPRGMLEFWIDPESPYAKPVFQEDKRFVFYCQSGWRSALATAVAGRLGLQQAAHLEGGFSSWKAFGGPIADYHRKPPRGE